MQRLIKGRKAFTIGELLIVFVIVVAMIFISLPFLRQVLARRDRGACANNLRELGLALYIYARKHEGKFPPTLKALYDEQFLSDRRLVDCPSSKNTGTPENPDYIYVAGLSIRDDSQVILVRDKAANHAGQGKNVLYLKGTVVWEEK